MDLETFPEKWRLKTWPAGSNNPGNASFFNLCQYILNMIGPSIWHRNYELMRWAWEGTKK